MPAPAQIRTKRIQIRVTPREDRLIRTAAKAKDVDVTDFMVTSALLEAEHALADRRHFELSPRAWKEFCDALDHPPRIIPRLQRLLAEPSILERP
jgi:uncharacterized protein (DUF1778 family)